MSDDPSDITGSQVSLEMVAVIFCLILTSCAGLENLSICDADYVKSSPEIHFSLHLRLDSSISLSPNFTNDVH